jgi:hypothetical protein
VNPEHRVLHVLCVCLLLVVLESSYAQNPADVSRGTTGVKPAEQVYKNIQVLKGIPSDQLIPAMRFMTASLGVECGFCHVEEHFDQDDKKPKQTARKMMRMVSAINQNSFDNHREVTCNSCHHGSRLPVSIPAVTVQPGMASLPNGDKEPQPNLPSADDLIHKYVEALGGASAIQKITTRAETGTAEFFGRQVDVQIFDKTPDKLLSTMHLPDGDSITALVGDQGWLIYPHRPLVAMSSSDVEATRIDADLQFPLHVKKLFPELKPAAPEKIAGRDAYQLLAVGGGQPRARFYFDQESGLLVRMVRYADSPLGLNPLQIDYSDYRPVNGVQVPFRWTTSRPEGQFTIQLTDVKHNIAIDDSKFVKPSAPSGMD